MKSEKWLEKFHIHSTRKRERDDVTLLNPTNTYPNYI